jgi:multiple antibiotic resistance protein
MGSVSEYINIFITLLAIVDPLGAIPIFISLTYNQPLSYQRRTIWVTSLAVCLILVGSALVGEKLIRIFGISVASFRVAGGILLLMVGITMLHAQQSFSSHKPEEVEEAAEKENIAVVPLAIPLLSGPGAISSMIIYAQRAPVFSTHMATLLLISLLVAAVTGATLYLARPVSITLGKTGMNIVIRLMGLLLAAAGVQFIANGLIQLFPMLCRS